MLFLIANVNIFIFTIAVNTCLRREYSIYIEAYQNQRVYINFNLKQHVVSISLSTWTILVDPLTLLMHSTLLVSDVCNFAQAKKMMRE